MKTTMMTVALFAAVVATAEVAAPAAIAPAWREFAAKCDAAAATRADLVAFKRFVAASGISEAEKAKWTAAAREKAQASRRKTAKAKEKTK